MKAQAPTIERINLHYQRLGLHRGWTRDRFHRLCQLLHWSPEELGAVCCVEPAWLAKWLRQSRFPTHISLMFCLLEGAYLDATCGGACAQPLMPLHLLYNHTPDPNLTHRHD